MRRELNLSIDNLDEHQLRENFRKIMDYVDKNMNTQRVGVSVGTNIVAPGYETAALPEGVPTGTLAFDETTSKLNRWNGSEWEEL